MLDHSDSARLAKLYEVLRLRLLDLSRKNQLLNYSLNPRSRRFLQIVDSPLEDVHRRLVADEASLRIEALPEPDTTPTEERTEEFRAALDRARSNDLEYLTALEALETTGRNDNFALDKLDRQLRDKIRVELELPPRPTRKEINRVDHARSLGIDPTFDLRDDKKSAEMRALQTLKFPDELESVMEKISGDARLAEQEMGLSTLFVAFGFLEWFESETSEKNAFAPLLLLPVQIEKTKVRGKNSYSLSLREGGAEANLSLQKLLETNFSRKLPDFELDDEDSVGSIESYLQQVAAAIDGLKRWQVRRWLVLGHFSFGRFAMYADLDPEKWGDVVGHDLVGSILRGVEQKADPNQLPSVPEDYPIDDPEIERLAPFLIQDADASQHSALIDVMKGSNLVIQGPPGTGKSQTITNIIANALAAGKRVLFLAEKQAALEVVKRRLDRAGLGQFCLELHSHKATSKSIIENLAERAELGWGKRSSDGAPKLDPDWRRNRQEVAAYVSALHAECAGGGTAFSLIWRALRGRRDFVDLQDALKSVKLPAELLENGDQITALASELAIYSDVQADFARDFGHPSRSPWVNVAFSDLAPFEAPRFAASLRDLREHNSALAAALAQYADLGVGNLNDLNALARATAAISAPPDPQLVLALRNLDLNDLETALKIRLELLRLDDELSAIADLRNEDPNRLAIVDKLLDSSLPEFADKYPDEVYRQADWEKDMLVELVRGLDGIIPVLDVLGLGHAAAAAWTPAVATAAIVLAMTPEYSRRWLFEFPKASQSSVVAAQKRWRALLDAEEQWKDTLQGYRPMARPAADVVTAVATTLRKTGMEQALTTLSGAQARARKFCQTLGLNPEKLDDCDALAAHLNELTDFERDDELSSLFGIAWAGLKTPIDHIREAIGIRDFLRSKLQGLRGEEAILEKITNLTPEAIDSLAATLEASNQFLGISTAARALLDTTPVSQVISRSRSRADSLSKFLALDPSRQLQGLNSSLRRIAHARGIISHEDRLRKSLAAHQTARAANSLGTNEAAIQTAHDGIAWIRSVRSAELPRQTRESLLSENAASVFLSLKQAAADFSSLNEQRQAIHAKIAEFGATDLMDTMPTNVGPLLDELVTRETELGAFISLRRLRSRLESAGLKGFLSICDLKTVESNRLPNLFRAVVAEHQASAARRAPGLSMSNGAAIEARRRAFADRDRIKLTADREAIKTRLLATMPPVGSNYGPRKHWTDMHLLLNEFQKQRRFTPARQLLARAGGAIQTLQPCFMMSPLSLAKFVGAGALDFDVLVIDEASQMRPEDALGGLLRAKQIVVVGDQNQLPPTDFFARADSHDAPVNEDEEDLDSESILEVCQTTFRERRRLKWHYRSRCESLIAFSNRWFYDDTLITFPTAKPGSFSIDLVRVDGIYQNRRNPTEAALIAEEAIIFMRHFANAPEEELPTLGVVAINLEQRELIQEELRRLSTDDELVELYCVKVERKGEPVFVKNLENVQGDERDHILISMTYGRKPGESSVAQNFGPVNRKQGHRRLNVLFTRARVRIGLFTSFGSADVRPTDSSSDGVHTLKRYLEYAETRGRAIVQSIGGEADSDFEREVAYRLRERNYKVELQVGVSGFKIDLGVRHPDRPEHFLAGVECDGAAYHSSKSARDRDRLREEALTGLGWQIVRVWSTDWFDNPELETEKLVRKLEELRKRKPPILDSYPSFQREAPRTEEADVCNDDSSNELVSNYYVAERQGESQLERTGDQEARKQT